MGRRNRDRVLAVVEWLKGAYPTPHAVLVKLAPKLRDEHGKRLCGYSYWDSTRRCQVLEIDTTMTFAEQLETLSHEWSHLVHMPNNRQHARRDLRPHDPLTGWGTTYAAIYSDLFDEPSRFKT